MLDRQIGAMIALSLLIGTPALVFANAERPRDDSLAHLTDYQLTPATASALEPTAAPDMVTAERWRDQWNGVDFPVRGKEQFAHTDTTRASDRSGHR